MKALLNILGGLFLIVGVVGIIYVVVAVANHNPDYSRFTQLLVPFVIHAASNFIGVILIGLAIRLGRTVPAGIEDTARSVGLSSTYSDRIGASSISGSILRPIRLVRKLRLRW